MVMKIKMYILFVFSILLVNSARSQEKLTIIDKAVRFGFRPAYNRTIDAVIIHSVFNASGGDKYDVDLVIKQFSHYDVSAHYVIGRDGSIYKLVDEKNVSYQAGKSSLPDGRTAVNSCSIGIEIITSMYESPTNAQINSVVNLVNDIKRRHKIKYVLRHSDIAPGRKTDPWNMNWKDFLSRLSKD